MEKLNVFGIGPRIGMFALPWLAITITVSILMPQYFHFAFPRPLWIFILGIVILMAGGILWIASGKKIVEVAKEPRLLTTGPFAICRNPLYLAMLMFVIPAISLLMNSWLILTTSVVGYIVFKSCVKQECEEMKRFFGADYEKYCSETPEFFPFAWKRWFRK